MRPATGLLLALLATGDPAPQADLAQLPLEEMVTRALQHLGELGTYRVTLTKEERIGPKMGPTEVIELVVREKPYAVRMDVVDGPAKGRRVLYNAALRPHQLRDREGGMAGVLGGLWVDIESSLSRDNTNHPVTHTGFAHVLHVSLSDLALAKPYGGRKRVDEGFDAQGRYCLRTEAPTAVAASSYARSGRTCVDPETLLPMEIEVYDAAGLLERYRYRNLRGHQEVPESFFTPEGAGL